MAANQNRAFALTLVIIVTAAMTGIGLGIGAGANSPTVSASNVTASPGEQATTELTIDSLPNGLKSYNLTITITNGSVGSIDTVSGGDLGSPQIISKSPNEYTIRGTDLTGQVQSNATDVSLASIDFTQLSAGESSLVISVNEITDDTGASISPAIDNGMLTVRDKVTISGSVSQPTGSPASGAVIVNTGAWPPTEASVNLDSTTGNYTFNVIPDQTYSRTYTQTTVSTFENPSSSEIFPNDNVPDIYPVGTITPNSPTNSPTEILPTGYNVTAKVVDSAGNPVNASVGIDIYPNSAVGPLREQPTGSDGMYQAHPNSPGIDLHGQVTVHADPFDSKFVQKSYTQDVTVDGSKDVTITVQEKSTTTAELVLQGAPNGLKKYSVSLNSTNNGTVSSFEGEQLSVQKLSGGIGQNFVEVRAADLIDVVGSTNSDIVLLRVEFTGNVSKQTLNKTIGELVDDDGNPIARNRVSLQVAGGGSGGQLFTSALPGSGAQAPPQDPDNDGNFEDINGDGQTNFDDALALAFVDDSQLSQTQIDAIDRDGDGKIDFNDAIDLAFDPLIVN